MKRALIAIALAAASLTGCAGTVTSPGQVADSTKLDEQIGIGAETAYTTASKLGTALAQAGVIDTAKFKAADAKAYAALLVVRAAYRAGNASGYQAAAVDLYAAVAQIRDLVK